MADVAIVFDDVAFQGDFLIGATDIATGSDLATNVMTSLFTNPGWWGNTFETDSWGCRLLELRRAKRTNATLLRARDYCKEALQWMIDDQVARSVDVQTEWQGSNLAISIAIAQATGTTRYSFVWKGV